MFRDPVVIAITAVAALVRFATLDVQSYWYDEALTVDLVNMSFGGMVGEVLDTQAQPPPYFMAAWAWVRVFGDGEVGLRSLSALFGTLTIPVVWAAAMHVGGRRVAIVASLLAALSPPLIWYSQEARGYALVTLLAAVSLLFFLRALDDPSRRNLGLWLAASLGAVASHYFALFVVLPQAAWLLWRGLDRPRALRWGGALAGGLLLLAPMLLYQREHGGAEWIGEEQFYPRLRDAIVFFVGGHHVPGFLDDGRPWLALASVVVFAAVAFVAVRASSGRVRMGVLVALGVGGIAVALPLLAAAFGSDFVLDRNFLPAWVPFALVAAVGITAARFRLVGAGILVLTVALFVAVGAKVATNDALQRDHWRTVAERIGPPRADRVVEAVPHWQVEALELYTEIQPMTEPRPVRELVLVSYTGFLPYNQPIRPLPPPPPFQETRRFYVQDITVSEFTSPEPVVVDPRAFTGVGDNRAEVFVERVG